MLVRVHIQVTETALEGQPQLCQYLGNSNHCVLSVHQPPDSEQNSLYAFAWQLLDLASVYSAADIPPESATGACLKLTCQIQEVLCLCCWHERWLPCSCRSCSHLGQSTIVFCLPEGPGRTPCGPRQHCTDSTSPSAHLVGFGHMVRWIAILLPHHFPAAPSIYKLVYMKYSTRPLASRDRALECLFKEATQDDVQPN